ncbi:MULTISPECIES: hypothetical protein [Halorussus]|uniref:hypothetical protein n=1 Tax=Halorussus TaxID=1070314 RepID=UPI00209FFBC4|nr:hypothetical protein [Halorussus vallis]
MSDAVRRRLDALLLLCSALLGIVVTYLFLSPNVTIAFFGYAVLPTALIFVGVSWYVQK